MTDSALGYDSQETDSQAVVGGESNSAASTTNGKENFSTEAKPSVCSFVLRLCFLFLLNDFQFIFQTPKPPFITWYNEHKSELQSEKQELKPSELTKYAMGKYKEIYPTVTNGKIDSASAKRKIDAENGSEPLTGVAKLAKFNFSK